MDYRLQTDPPLTAAASTTVFERAGQALAPLRPRLDGIDFLRGLVMIVMVLDHARDYLGGSSMNPRDVQDTALFLTRWITHFCAPIFILLAGVAAYLYGNRGRSTAEVARFLFTRGLWLIFIELTLVRFAWTFNLAYDFAFLQVIWAIGCSMLALGCLIYLPRWAIATFAILVIAGHNLLDGVQAAQLGSAAWLWTLIHAPGTLAPAPGMQWLAIYPLLPWVGVMAAGYALGPILLLPEEQRRRVLLRVGLVVIAGFLLLRAANGYGDPAQWSRQSTTLATVLSFINCEKYPPSLLYLAMTLGPGLLVLALFGSARSAFARIVVTIGRVPFLFYVAHIFVVHALAIALAWTTSGEAGWLFEGMPVFAKPAGYGLSLPGVYLGWIGALLVLYPICRWFGALKQRRKDWWLSYL